MTGKILIFLSLLLLGGFSAPLAHACRFNIAQAEKDSAAAFFTGKVKIIAVEYAADKQYLKPKVTYEIIEAESKTEGFDDKTIVTDAGPLSSCDFSGPWNVGDVVYEEFFIKDGKPHSSTINMRAVSMGKFSK